jgi:hypothetical protein
MKRNMAMLYMAMSLIVVFVAYAILEIAAHSLGFPDPRVIEDLEREQELASANGVENFFDSKAPIYGWDQDMVSALPTARSAPINNTTFTILFSGDSVTRGFGVDISKEAYPMLLFKLLNEKTNVRVLNVAVQGFGVDQMMLKLEEVVPKYRPELIVFAYIPHDLWRPARNINYGYTKPVLIPDTSENWKIIPSPNIIQFYKDYAHAKDRYYLSLWSLRHLVYNLRYYFPKFYTGYYRGLFEEIRDRLIVLSEQYDVEILIVRLASSWSKDPVPYLDRMAQHIFASSSDIERYHYYDSEDCVRAKSAASDIDYDKEFKYHPSAVGHEIYRDCLINPIETLSMVLRQRITN